MEMEKSLYYDPQKLITMNRILNFVIGARGIGKSYSFKKYPIQRFLKKGKQFIYLRRYKDELKKIKRYFNDVMTEFPNHEFKVKGKEFYIDGKLAGFAMPLSQWQSFKSDAFPDVETIIFEEFIREKDNSGYIPNEVNALLNLMDTVFRDRPNCRVFCLSNAVTIVNPYFLYFNIVPDINKRFNKNESICVEIPDSTDFSVKRRETAFGKLIDGTDYGEMALDNKFINDSQTFIEKRTKTSKFVFSIVYKGMTMGIWVDTENGLMYLSQDHDPSIQHSGKSK
jgi:hypothetical protein